MELNGYPCIRPDDAVQQVLFECVSNRPERLDISRTIDTLDHKSGLEGVYRTPNYLTDLDELLTVQI